MLIAKESLPAGEFVAVNPGTHLAMCYRVIDLGTQKVEWQGQTKMLPKVMLQFEVHGEDDTGSPMVTSKGEPLSISKNYTLSLGDKSSLRRDLQSWRGRDFTAEELRGFEMKNLLGQWAMITVSKSAGANGRDYTNIVSITSVPAMIKKQGLPQPFNKPRIFSLTEPDMDLFEAFGPKLKEKIALSPEWQSRHNSPADLGDDVPF